MDVVSLQGGSVNVGAWKEPSKVKRITDKVITSDNIGYKT